MATTVRSLAEEGKRFIILTKKPVNPASPTVAELTSATDAIDASCKVSTEGFSWTPTDSDTIDDRELCSTSNAVAPGADNAELSFQVYRYFLDTGGVDTAADKLFAAVKTKGTVLWGYYFHNDSTVAPIAGEQFVLGAEFWVDHPQDTGEAGWLKFRVPCRANKLYPWSAVSAT